MDNLVSIITPNYNCEKFIAQTIESVIAQTYTDWEMIIVDDHSEDSSFEIIKKYASKEKRIKAYRMDKNSGAALCRNRAIEEAQGEFIAFLDSDDLWFPNKLKEQIAFMKERGSDFSFSEYDLMDENGNILGLRSKVIKRLTYTKMLFHTFTGCLTVIYNQKAVGKVSGPDVKNCNDKALFLEILKKTKRALGYKKSLALYRIRKNSISHVKLKMVKPYFEVLYKYEKIPIIFIPFLIFTHFLIKKVWKYKKL